MKTTHVFYALFFVVFSSSAQNLNDSLLIYYPFDGNALDQSGNGYDGIANATLGPDQYGNPNSAYIFNGFNQYIDFPNNTELKPELPISFSVWVKFDVIDATKTVIVTNNFAIDQHAGVWLNTSSTGRLAINYGSAAGGSGDPERNSKLGNTVLQANIWYHVAGVVRGYNDMDLYIDCVNDGGTYAGNYSGQVGYTVDAGSIGRKDVAGPPPYYFQGSLDDFRYWKRALNPADITELCHPLNIDENDLSEVDFQIFPNPTDHFIIVKGNTELVHSILVFDLSGNLVLRSENPSSINISNLQSGMYLITLLDHSGTQLKSERIVKN